MRPNRNELSLSDRVLILLEKQHLLTVPQMLAALEKANHKANKTSVYRALENLIERQQVTRQSFGGNEIWYETLEPAYHHDHLICENCGDIESYPCAVKLPRRPHGFKVNHHALTIYGMCEKCQLKTKSA